MSPRTAAGGTHLIPLFASASDPLGRQGFARIINHSEESGEVRIDAFDDRGDQHGPVTLHIGARRTVHFNSDDLEEGNTAKGLEGATGSGEGHWRLLLTSELDLEVFAYMRTGDGFLTSLHDRVPESESGHRVVIFNPGSNANQVSLLRLINPGEEPADVTIEGIDGKGRMAEEAVRLELPAGASRMLSAGELESGDAEGLTGALGTGSGKWQLAVSSEQAIEVMSLLLSARTEHGHMTNLSTVPDNAEPGEDGARTVHTVGLFPAASRLMRDGYQGFVRIINRSGESGEVRIDAIDDEGTEFGPVTLGDRSQRDEALQLGRSGDGQCGQGSLGGHRTGCRRLASSPELEPGPGGAVVPSYRGRLSDEHARRRSADRGRVPRSDLQSGQQ